MCGKKAVRVFWLPRVYIDRVGSIVLSSAIVVTAFFVFAVPAMVRSSEESGRADMAEKARLDAMPQAWRSLYYSVEAVSFKKAEVVTSFAFSHTPSELPPLDAGDMKMILDKVDMEKTSAVNALTPYLKTK